MSKTCSIYFDNRYFDTLAHYLCCPYIFKMDHKKSLYQMTYGTFFNKGEENLLTTKIYKLKSRLVATVSSRLISHVILCAYGGVNRVRSWHFLSRWANSFGENTQFSQCGNSYSMVGPWYDWSAHWVCLPIHIKDNTCYNQNYVFVWTVLAYCMH